jgi:ribonuclease BN (tRNA processing enzyme)
MTQQQPFSVRCFGTADGMPSAQRNHAAFLYRLGETSILVDCGESVDASFKASGLSYDAIDALIISHLHADHFGGLFMLLQGFWLEGRRKSLTIYLPEYAIGPLRQMLEAAMLLEELLQFRLRLLPIPEAEPLSIGQARVRAFRTSHLDDLRSQLGKKYEMDFASYCFLIEAGGRRIGHSADLGKPEDLAPLLTQPLDLLVCELAHFRPEHLFIYLKLHKIKRVVFVHLARGILQKFAQVQELATTMLPDFSTSFPNDQEEITI